MPLFRLSGCVILLKVIFLNNVRKIPVEIYRTTSIPGLCIIRLRKFEDKRGVFIKNYNSSFFHEIGVDSKFEESFFNVSKSGVIRGMHLQLAPADHNKLITVVNGRILDVVLDLRFGCNSFGVFEAFELDADNALAVVIPKGCAHGFLALEDYSIVNYMTTSVHVSSLDTGVRWDSFGFSWPVEFPIISDRDKELPTLNSFIKKHCR